MGNKLSHLVEERDHVELLIPQNFVTEHQRHLSYLVKHVCYVRKVISVRNVHFKFSKLQNFKNHVLLQN